MRKLTTLLIVASMIVMVLIGFIGCTAGEMQALQGTLQNIDDASGNITVRLADGSTRTFNFNDVQIETIRDALGSASLEIGDEVTIHTNEIGKIRELEVQNAEVEGIIENIGTDNVTIKTNGVEITLQVPSTVRISIGDNRTATFLGLKVGEEVQVKYDVTSKNVLSIKGGMEGKAENYFEENYEELKQRTIQRLHSDNKTVDNNSREDWEYRRFSNYRHSLWADNPENWDYRRFSNYQHFSWSSSDNQSVQYQR